jgi:hypothetical protein
MQKMKLQCLHTCRTVDVRLLGEGKLNSHSARLVHLIITMLEWIRTSRLSIRKSLSLHTCVCSRGRASLQGYLANKKPPAPY